MRFFRIHKKPFKMKALFPHRLHFFRINRNSSALKALCPCRRKLRRTQSIMSKVPGIFFLPDIKNPFFVVFVFHIGKNRIRNFFRKPHRTGISDNRMTEHSCPVVSRKSYTYHRNVVID
jgi:hypothetical protein